MTVCKRDYICNSHPTVSKVCNILTLALSDAREAANGVAAPHVSKAHEMSTLHLSHSCHSQQEQRQGIVKPHAATLYCLPPLQN